MRAGRFKKRITVQRVTNPSQDELGGNVGDFVTIGTHWARVNRLSGSRGLEFEKVNNSRPFNITVRGDVDILEDDLIIYEGQTLTIISVETDEDFTPGKFKFIITGAKYKG